MKKHILGHKTNKPFSPLHLLYNVGMYLFLTIALPYFIIKIATTKKYRSGILHRLGFIPKHKKNALTKGQHIWLHAVSVGEVNASIPLLEKLKSDYPGKNIILSTTTLTGQNIARQWADNDPRITVIYFPLDFYHIFSSLFRKCNINLIILMETEIWPNFLLAAHTHSIPVVLVNGRLSEKSYRGYMKLRKFFLKSIRPIQMFCTQTPEDAQKFKALGILSSRVAVTGNLKYESALTITSNKDICIRIKRYLGWTDNMPIWVVGSTHHGEEELICETYRTVKEQFPRIKMIIAPRHPERIKDVVNILRDNSIEFIKKSECDKCSAPLPISPDVVLLDTMGELRHIYSLATVVFIGKSLVPGGGQNILEPASVGKAIVFGPHMENFARITRSFLDAHAGIMVNNQSELTATILSLLSDKQRRDQLGKNALHQIQQYKGATDSIFAYLKKYL